MFRVYFIKKKWLIAALIAIVALVLALTFLHVASRRAATTSASPGACAWGIKRDGGHQTPEVPADGAAWLDACGGRYLGDPALSRVYLTFDEGYEAGHTAALLDVLKEKQVHAVFFITGWYLESQPDLVARMLDEGHDVGNHTVDHKNPTTIPEADARADIVGLSDAFEKQFSRHMRFYRPPEGVFCRRTLEIAQEEGLTPLMWTWAYQDWEKPKGKEYVCKLAQENAHNGMVFLFHVTTTDPVESLGTIIDKLRADGYVIGEPGELISLTLAGQ